MRLGPSLKSSKDSLCIPGSLASGIHDEQAHMPHVWCQQVLNDVGDCSNAVDLIQIANHVPFGVGPSRRWSRMNFFMGRIRTHWFTKYLQEVLGILLKEFLQQLFMLSGKFDSMKICYLRGW